MEAVDKADHPLYPREIAFTIKEKKNTVCVLCRRLFKKGLLLQPFPGVYNSMTKPKDGVGVAGFGVERPPRLQNFVVQFNCVIPEGVISCFERSYGSVGLRVLFGRKRQRVTGYLSCPEGLDLNSLIFALETFRYVVASYVGVFPSDDVLRVKTSEFLQDYQNIKLNGISCLTVESFLGSFEKLYNKGDGVRSEVRVHPDSVEAIYTLLKGGVTSYNVVQLAFLTLTRLDKLLEAVKYQNQGLQSIQHMIFEFLQRFGQGSLRDLPQLDMPAEEIA